ncbi:hypothetical protein SUGI_1031510 [Cryptomeria japonica]|nr:hypothetical protein SUGI_1031510 [Cryptomeria japonica]
MMNWKLKKGLNVILDICGQLESITFAHMYREANRLADRVANLGVDLDNIEHIWLEEDMEKDLVEIANKDFNGD